MNRGLRGFLRKRGASREEIERAEAEGWLALLTFDRLVLPGEPRHTMQETAERAGTDLETTSRIWRALGFPDLPSDFEAFSDNDVDALAGFVARLEAPPFPYWSLDHMLPQVRVLSSALARIAEVESEDITSAINAARATGMSDEDVALELLDRLDFDSTARLLDHMHRLQMRASVWRKLALGDPGVSGDAPMAVGFVDLVGYTALSRQLDEEQLIELVSRFDEVAHDTIVRLGSRIVKMIGDEVMFVAEDAATAADVALELTERATVDDVLPSARAAVAFGPVLLREGDYYGPVVNLASRIVAVAKPGTLVVPDEMHEELVDDLRFEWRRLRTRRFQDIGRVELWSARRGHPSLQPVRGSIAPADLPASVEAGGVVADVEAPAVPAKPEPESKSRGL